jgi:hypothetical protein
MPMESKVSTMQVESSVIGPELSQLKTRRLTRSAPSQPKITYGVSLIIIVIKHFKRSGPRLAPQDFRFTLQDQNGSGMDQEWIRIDTDQSVN